MTPTVLELMPSELQGVPMSEADVARAANLAAPANEQIRQAANQRMAFEDEPAQYYALLDGHPVAS